MKLYGFKEKLKKEDVADFLGLGGEKSTDSIDKYERNAREPQAERVKELADLFDVSDYAIRRYNFVDPNEVIYYHMWEEMRERRINSEISDSEYMEWKLHFDLKDID